MGETNGISRNDWKSRLATFDFEVTAYDWLLVIKDYVTKKYYAFHNDPQGVEEFIDGTDHIFVGYNNKHYDNYILKGVLNHYPPEDIKKINDYIIVERKNGWEYPFDNPYIKLPATTDLMLDMPLRQSLKELEGNMLMDIQESTIDFNIDHPWNKEEFEEMVYYCKHDVDSTERLVDERMDYLESKVSLGELCGLSIEESLYRTNAQLAAKSLGAEKVEHNDYHDYVIPPEVNQSMVPKSILDFIEKFRTVKEDELTESNFKLQWKGNIAGVPHVIGLGGIHGAIENYQEESNDNRIIVNYDVSSYYPSLLIEYKYLSRNVKDSQIYTDYYHDRIAAKKAKNKKKANGLKLVLNTTYGASLQKFNDLYDPLMGVSTCLTGQLLLTQLIITLETNVKSFRLIQSNTDGIMFSLNRDELEIARFIVEKWSKNTRLGMEEDQIKKVVQKDVNNYVIEMFNGDLKFKGAYLSDYPNGSFKHNSMSVVAEAVIKNLMYGESIEDIINMCDEPFRFQIIAKTGSTYDKTVHYVDGDEIQVQKVNRLYAIKNERYGVVKKVKKQYLELDEDGERRYYINLKGKRTYKKKWETDEGGDYFVKKDTTQNCPEHAFIDNSCQISVDMIDKEWYINLARKRINDFLGIKEEKRGGKKMTASAKKETKVEVNPRVALYQKIFNLGKYLRNQDWSYDSYNKGQDYEYTKGSKYREILGKGCLEVGLVFKFSLANRIFTDLPKSQKMSLVSVLGSISLIDVDTGEHEDYQVIGDGSDNLDKGIYKAETMMLKYFVKNNFLLPENKDDIDAESGKEEEVKTSKKAPVTVKERVEAKEKVMSNDQATEKEVKEAIEVINEIRKAEGKDSKGREFNSYGEKALKVFNDFLDGKVGIKKTEFIKMRTSIDEELDEASLEF